MELIYTKKNQNGFFQWSGHCNSGPIKIGIFDIYSSMLTRSNCLGLSVSSSIFNYEYIFDFFNTQKIIFGCMSIGSVPESQEASSIRAQFILTFLQNVALFSIAVQVITYCHNHKPIRFSIQYMFCHRFFLCCKSKVLDFQCCCFPALKFQSQMIYLTL